MNKYIVIIYVPILNENFDVLIPNNKRVIDIIYHSSKIINSLFDGEFGVKNYNLINRDNGNIYDLSLLISETDIKNGSELILI